MNSIPLTRRKFLLAVTASSALAAATGRLSGATEMRKTPSGQTGPFATGNEEILILLFPGFTAMDAIGPEYFLSCMMGAKVRFIAKTREPVPTESGFLVAPHLSFDDLPKSPTLFLVPGGTSGILGAIQDKDTVAFVRRAGLASALAGSVCTGSLLLGSSGLLDGYEATSHWETLRLLPLFGAFPSTNRVVFDRNRVTAAGVTAGLDLALQLVRLYRGDFYAAGCQLLGQYDPQPLFAGGGSPATANPETVSFLEEMHTPFVKRIGEAINNTYVRARKS